MPHILHPSPPEASPILNVSQPFNDIQLVALIAGQLDPTNSPQERVAEAIDLVAEAIAQMQSKNLLQIAQAKSREYTKAN